MFMAVALKGQWRHPVSYYLVDRTSNGTLAEFANSELCEIADFDLKVKVVVADDLKANLAMFGHFGVIFDPKKMKPGVSMNYFFFLLQGRKCMCSSMLCT